ncbi:MAG: hypothetical protein LBV22_02025 [Mycoplasmataceae bacterium]|jgi:hypothetical protein|nr:hypothetical protein [Mycoplasmataceae bacterium]
MLHVQEKAISVLKKHNLKIICCEHGTAGLVSNLLSCANTNDAFIMGFVLNNQEIIKSLFEVALDKDVKTIIYEISLQALRKVNKADICITTYVEKTNVHICLIFLDKNYITTKEIGSDENNYSRAAFEAMTFLSNYLEKIDK